MKYLIRSIKYFVHLLIILALVLFALVKLNMVSADIEAMFRNGYDSLWQIGLMLLVFSALYPKWGYAVKETRAAGSYSELRAAVKAYMEDRGYVLDSEADETMVFKLRAPISRLIKLYEDKVTISKTLTGFDVEGLSRDIYRISSGLEARLNLPAE